MRHAAFLYIGGFAYRSTRHLAYVVEVIQKHSSANLQALRTFNLQISRASFTQGSCSKHGTEQCDCQFVVLLVYRDKFPPTSLIAHGQNSKTWFALVDSPNQRISPRSMAVIRQALNAPEVLHNGEHRLLP